MDAVVCRHHSLGGEGAIDLGHAVVKACSQPSSFQFLYDLDQPIKVRLAGHCKSVLGLASGRSRQGI